MTPPLGAINAASGWWHKAVLLVEGRIFENEQDDGINPELKMAEGEEDALLLPCPLQSLRKEAAASVTSARADSSQPGSGSL